MRVHFAKPPLTHCIETHKYKPLSVPAAEIAILGRLGFVWALTDSPCLGGLVLGALSTNQLLLSIEAMKAAMLTQRKWNPCLG